MLTVCPSLHSLLKARSFSNAGTSGERSSPPSATLQSARRYVAYTQGTETKKEKKSNRAKQTSLGLQVQELPGIRENRGHKRCNQSGKAEWREQNAR
jgi:hypothetical protein